MQDVWEDALQLATPEEDDENPWFSDGDLQDGGEDRVFPKELSSRTSYRIAPHVTNAKLSSPNWRPVLSVWPKCAPVAFAAKALSR